MDDLAGLSWTPAGTQGSGSKAPPPAPSASMYPALRPTPSPQSSGRSTPFGGPAPAPVNGNPGKPAAPALDPFSSLAFGSAKQNTSQLSIREQQQRLEAEKQREAEAKRRQMQSQYGNGQFWDAIGKGAQASPPPAATVSKNPFAPSPRVEKLSPLTNSAAATEEDANLFAAFKSETAVDNSSHFPPPSEDRSSRPVAATPSIDLTNPNAWRKPGSTAKPTFDDDDDPFGLNTLPSRPSAAATSVAEEEGDDLLGDLGRPVEEVRREQEARRSAAEPGKPIEDSSDSSDDEPEGHPAPGSSDPFDRAVAEVMELGFSAGDARRALTESGQGLNVQAAVGWLLDEAHRKAKQEALKGKGGAASSSSREGREERPDRGRQQGTAPAAAWMREDGSRNSSQKGSGRFGAGDGDITKTAAAVGSNLLKTAGSLWKTGQKSVQKAVADFTADSDPSQPKWMRSAAQSGRQGAAPGRSDVTDEALMLESGGLPERKPDRAWASQGPGSGQSSGRVSRDQSPANVPQANGRNSQTPRWQQQQKPASNPSLLDPRARLSKQLAEEQGAQAYISPSRRKTASPKPPLPARQEAEPDLLFGASAPSSKSPQPTLAQQPQQSSRFGTQSGPSSRVQSQAPSRTITPRPTPPRRQIPPIPASALQVSTKHRLEGTAHFKRGDYAAAHTSYTASLTGIPRSHPLAIVLLTNRALTSLKTGEPRQAVEDADAALATIGPSRGEGETVAVAGGAESGGAEQPRDMKELYGKALSRKAEALEQMEKWADAGEAWRLCVESGVGGPTAMAGRQRCQKALAPKAPPAPSGGGGSGSQRRPATSAVRPRPRPPPATATGQSSEAVARLRAANKAAEAADDEKFALSERIDARVGAWRDGKRENLRALLASLDAVLWEGSGWKKVGLHELVVANKVKIVYMRAIAKTHPDKLPQDASTEVRLIAGTVFSTLNESWDKFKAENGL